MDSTVVGYAQHTDVNKADMIAADTKKVKTKLTELEQKARTFNAHEGIFGLEQTDNCQAGKIVEELEPFDTTWLLCEPPRTAGWIGRRPGSRARSTTWTPSRSRLT